MRCAGVVTGPILHAQSGCEPPAVALTPTQIGNIYCGSGDSAVFDVLDSGSSVATTDSDYPGLDDPCRERTRAQVGWPIAAGAVALAAWGATVYRVRRLPRKV